MKGVKAIKLIGLLSNIFLILLIQSCLNFETEEKKLEDTSWYLKKTILYFEGGDSTIMPNVTSLETIMRLRKKGLVEICYISLDSGVVCKPFKNSYDDIVYSNINWSVNNDTLITPKFKDRILRLTEDSLVLSSSRNGTEAIRIWGKIAI